MSASLRSWLRIGPASLTLGVTVLVVGLFGWGAPLLDLLELRTYDLRFRSRGPLPASPAVVLAVIDEKSVDVEGRWPWPRSKLAALIDALSRDGVRVIGFDIAFTEPDENSHVGLIDRLAREVDAFGIRDPRLTRFIGERRRDADNDQALATAIKNSAAPVVLGYFFHMSDVSLGYRLEPEEVEKRLQRLARFRYPMILSSAQAPDAERFIMAHTPEPNLDLLADVAASAGFFSLRSDPDGVLRWMPLVIRAGEDFYPPLAMMVAWHHLGRPQLRVHVGRHGVDGVQLGDRFIPTDEAGQLLINYLGPSRTIQQFSVTDILNGKVAPGTFKDRAVLIGATALGIHDLRSTPFSPLFPGMEVQGTVVDNIITGRFLARPEWSRIFDVLAIVVFGGVVGFALPRLSALNGLVFAAVVFVGYIVAARWLFTHAQVWLNVVYPLLALTGTYTALTAYHYVTEQRERKKVKETFSQYVAPTVVEEVLKDPRRLKLGGDEKVLTVLFSDLEGFTRYSERYSPAEMVDMLGDYYNSMTEQIFTHGGTLTSYVADEVMAIFGAPLEQPDHAHRACATALAMRAQRRALAEEWGRVGRPRLRARTGINSGAMLVGNLGSRYRFAYGALGDHVNLASRIEGLNKVYGTEIILAENTARLVDGAFVVRELDTVRVLGRTQPVRIYELMAGAGTALSPEQQQVLALYAAGLEAYRHQDWSEALTLFEKALTLRPDDGPCRAMLERATLFQEVPPLKDWDGVFEQLVKG